MRRGRAREILLTSSTILSCRDTILHNASNKNKLTSILCEDSVTNNTQLINKQNCSVNNCEADITLCSYMLKAVEDGAKTILILSDDTEILVLVVYWVGMKIITPTFRWKSGMATFSILTRLFISWDQGSVVSFLECMLYLGVIRCNNQ